jgi:hypothetical protein
VGNARGARRDDSAAIVSAAPCRWANFVGHTTAVARPPTLPTPQTLKRNSITSPSFTTYSFPSDRITPFSFTPFQPPCATKSS